MRTLTIHNVPDRLHERLAARAAAHRRRPEEEALTVLDEALASDLEATEAEQRKRAEAAFARIDALRESMPPVPADIVAQLDALRERTAYEAPPGEIEALVRDLRDSQ